MLTDPRWKAESVFFAARGVVANAFGGNAIVVERLMPEPQWVFTFLSSEHEQRELFKGVTDRWNDCLQRTIQDSRKWTNGCFERKTFRACRVQ